MGVHAVLGVGQVGTALVELLVRTGHQVVTYDKYKSTKLPGVAAHYNNLPRLLIDHHIEVAIDTTGGRLRSCVPKNVPYTTPEEFSAS
jgi:predicted dinucleotide-binding enzyme